MLKYKFLNIISLTLFLVAANARSKSSDSSSHEENLKHYSYDTWCKLQPNGQDCEDEGYKFTFYYDIKMQACTTFRIGKGCPENTYNSFSTLVDCNEYCRDEGLKRFNTYMNASIYCRLQPDFGDCHGYFPMYYFDVTLRQCRGFSFSGCGGNYNRFTTSQQCVSTCVPLVSYGTKSSSEE